MRQVVLGVGLVWGSEAVAISLCREPNVPSCVTWSSTYEGQSEFDYCVNAIEGYQRDLEQYLDCVNRETTEAISQYNRTIEYFNCEASGNGFCSRP